MKTHITNVSNANVRRSPANELPRNDKSPPMHACCRFLGNVRREQLFLDAL